MKKSFLIAIMQKGQLKSTDSFEYTESSNLVSVFGCHPEECRFRIVKLD